MAHPRAMSRMLEAAAARSTPHRPPGGSQSLANGTLGAKVCRTRRGNNRKIKICGTNPKLIPPVLKIHTKQTVRIRAPIRPAKSPLSSRRSP